MREPTFTPEQIRALRQAAGLTQESFAHEIGVTVSTINRWESGACRLSRLGARALAAFRDRGREGRDA